MSHWFFHIEEPGSKSIRVAISPGFTLGRHANNTHQVGDQTTGNHHFRVVEEDGQWFIEDLGSKNKTKIADGTTLTRGCRYPLIPNLGIRVGRTRIRAERVEAPPQPSSAPPPPLSEGADPHSTVPDVPNHRNPSPPPEPTTPPMPSEQELESTIPGLPGHSPPIADPQPTPQQSHPSPPSPIDPYATIPGTPQVTPEPQMTPEKGEDLTIPGSPALDSQEMDSTVPGLPPSPNPARASSPGNVQELDPESTIPELRSSPSTDPLKTKPITHPMLRNTPDLSGESAVSPAPDSQGEDPFATVPSSGQAAPVSQPESAPDPMMTVPNDGSLEFPVHGKPKSPLPKLTPPDPSQGPRTSRPPNQNIPAEPQHPQEGFEDTIHCGSGARAQESSGSSQDRKTRLIVITSVIRERVAVHKVPFSIGCDDSVDLSVKNFAVSPDHAMIYSKDDGFVLQDRNSGKSTTVNSVRLKPGESIELPSPSSIRFGTVEMLFLNNDAKQRRSHRKINLAAGLRAAQSTSVSTESLHIAAKRAEDEDQDLAEVLLLDGQLTPARWVKDLAETRKAQEKKRRRLKNLFGILALLGAALAGWLVFR